MRKLHLMIDCPTDPWQSETYCGISAKGDQINWTFNRKKLLNHQHACQTCLTKSIPEQPMPIGHAARELDVLEYFNRLHRDPPKVEITHTLQRRLLKYITTQPASTTSIALDLEMSVRVIAAHLETLRRKGVIYFARGTWDIVEEPIHNYFKLVDPETVAAGRVLRK